MEENYILGNKLKGLVKNIGFGMLYYPFFLKKNLVLKNGWFLKKMFLTVIFFLTCFEARVYASYIIPLRS